MAYASWHTTVTDLQGNVIPNASIYVVNETTGIAPQLYADRQGLVPMGNPFTAEADGTVNLYVAGGAYRIRASFGAWERTWRYVGIGTAQEYDIDGLGAYLQSGLTYTQTLAELNAITPTDFPAGGVVLADPVGANNGYYTNQGSGWIFARPLPDTFGRLYATGGTANNVQATLDAGVNPSSPTVFFIDVTTPNTGPVTLTVNGQNEGPVLNAAGNPLAAGEWQGRVLFTREGSGDYRILNDPASALSAAQSASEASSQADRAEDEADRAEAAADSVGNVVTYTPQTPTAAEQAQARANIGVGEALGNTVQVIPQSFTPEQQAQAQDNIGFLNALAFGAVPDSVTPSADAIQALLDFRKAGRVVIPAGDYFLEKDIVIRAKRIALESSQVFEVDATGVRFYGPGRVVVDGSKRIKLSGFYAPGTDLVLNGCWWGLFVGLQFRDMILCESAGQIFTSNYWNTFTSCIFQVAKASTGAAAGSNAFTFIECSMRGSDSQGFASARDYAFEFAGDHLAQAWTFIGGDVSYYNIDIYTVPASNPTREVSIHFEGTYFDQKLPAPTTRPGVRITTSKCVAGVALHYAARLDGATIAPQDMFVQSRLFHLTAKGGVNLIPNGDFREQNNTSYNGVGRPLSGISGATVTRNVGGPTGYYLNINQPSTSSNAVIFRARSTEQGYYSTLLALRNAGGGTKTVRMSVFGDSFFPITLGSEWSFIPYAVTSGQKAADINLDVHLYTEDGTGFNIDVGYAGIFLGIGGDLTAEPVRPRRIYHSFTYNPPSIAAGDAHVYAHTMWGAEPGDFVQISASESLQGIILSPYINVSDAVALNFFNPTGETVDLGNLTFRVIVEKPPY